MLLSNVLDRKDFWKFGHYILWGRFGNLGTKDYLLSKIWYSIFVILRDILIYNIFPDRKSRISGHPTVVFYSHMKRLLKFELYFYTTLVIARNQFAVVGSDDRETNCARLTNTWFSIVCVTTSTDLLM